MKNRIIIVAAILAFIAFAIVWVATNRKTLNMDTAKTTGVSSAVVESSCDENQPIDEPIQHDSAVQASSASDSQAQPPTMDDVTASSQGDPGSQLVNDNVAQTRNMVMAHVSLREPIVADPDSEENKRILQEMIFKALANPVQ